MSEKGKYDMKKTLLVTAALMIALSISSCGKKDASDSANKTQNNVQQNVTDISDNYAEGASENVNMNKVDGETLKSDSDKSDASATLEQSAVSIEDAKLVEVDGNQCVIISYKFTNKRNADESFTSMMKSEVYQDGMIVPKAIGNFEIEGFEPNSTAERIPSGKTITVQEIYNLVNDAPIEVQVKEFHSETGENVTKTFNIQ